MPSVAIAGGGLAGLAAAAALGSAGFDVDLFEARSFPGGRATSYEAGGETIDNCQHILLRCCVNLLDFYARLGVAGKVEFHRTFHFLEPGGRRSVMERGWLPAPAHFTGSFLRLKFLEAADKLAVARGLLALRREAATRTDLGAISMLDWLREKQQTPRAIERFWRQILVSAINEELDRTAAEHGFQVFRLGFLARRDSYEMGIPRVPLGELYGAEAWRAFPRVRLHLKHPAERFTGAAFATAAGEHHADYFISALPFERVRGFAPDLAVDLSGFEHSPITGIHLWFDRPVTDLPHATLLDRTVQWLFNKDRGRYVQLVVSASRSLESLPRREVIDLALRELAEFFPAARDARLEKAHVVKEVRATFSARPGLRRPGAETNLARFFLAGDWTASGWPATMEGAVRSGYLAAEAVARAAGTPRRFLLPDIA